MPKLTTQAVRNAKHSGRATAGGKMRPERIGDGDGLCLQITPENAKSWLFRFTLRGQAREMGLGPCDLSGNAGLTLAQAREAAAEARRVIRAGHDPIQARREKIEEAARKAAEAKANVVTFRDATKATLEKMGAKWRSDKHRDQWVSSLERYAFPIIGDRPVASIDKQDVLRILQPIWPRVPETASRLRQRIEAVLDQAGMNDWRSEDDNPAKLSKAVMKALRDSSHSKPTRHHPSLPWQALPDFWAALGEVDGMGAAALRFCILTGARTGEVRLLTWRELDLANGVWAVPAERMKANKLHRVPLSPQALDVLRSVLPAKVDSEGCPPPNPPKAPNPDDLVFPSYRGGALSDMSVSAVVRRMNAPKEGDDPNAPPRWRDIAGQPVVPHGFRATFKAWSLAKGWPDHLSELALAHTDRNKVRASYAREDHLEERAPMMVAWAEWATRAPTPAEVRDLAAERARRGLSAEILPDADSANSPPLGAAG